MSWYVDETYLKVRGRWTYLHRAIDRDGNLIDAMLSEHRDMKAAKAFFRSARAVTGFRPDRVTTDGHGSYPRVIRTVLGKAGRHRTSAYLNNRLEQDHRGTKGRIRCMRSFQKPRCRPPLLPREELRGGETRAAARCRAPRKPLPEQPGRKLSPSNPAARAAHAALQVDAAGTAFPLRSRLHLRALPTATPPDDG
ncbi:DDE-type integrase/transposase/recombinase (plasmid) [Lichenicola cladoniae]|uniref:DDE-type integrase/transposase/recombinase n=1 Tax=Lichenicola cladoniae TaxID=1484109 RepID=A0A6M8HZR6_9PROT|nr:DDE-type integrase/transposase/recombinase [Acetobacteraceae bacterium]QKE93645.1 DDE-type integrase/transposase/recombinase [Lichenicola cladoniae]